MYINCMFRILSKVCVSFLEYLRHFNWIVPQVPVLRMLKTWWFHLFWHRMTKAMCWAVVQFIKSLILLFSLCHHPHSFLTNSDCNPECWYSSIFTLLHNPYNTDASTSVVEVSIYFKPFYTINRSPAPL